MLRLLSTSVLLTATLGCGLSPADTTRVLLVVGSPPFHDIVNLPPILMEHLETAGGFSVQLAAPPPDDPANTDHMDVLSNVSSDQFDVIIFSTSVFTLPTHQESGLRAFLESGGGVVALHGAAGSFLDSGFWGEALGARFTGHAPGTSELQVRFVNRSHPITEGVTDFTVTDEEYCHALDPTVQREVLAEFSGRPEVSECSDGPNDMMWTRAVGAGRLFYNALGHTESTWRSPEWLRLARQGVEWASGHTLVD